MINPNADITREDLYANGEGLKRFEDVETAKTHAKNFIAKEKQACAATSIILAIVATALAAVGGYLLFTSGGVSNHLLFYSGIGAEGGVGIFLLLIIATVKSSQSERANIEQRKKEKVVAAVEDPLALQELVIELDLGRIKAALNKMTNNQRERLLALLNQEFNKDTHTKVLTAFLDYPPAFTFKKALRDLATCALHLLKDKENIDAGMLKILLSGLNPDEEEDQSLFSHFPINVIAFVEEEKIGIPQALLICNYMLKNRTSFIDAIHGKFVPQASESIKQLVTELLNSYLDEIKKIDVPNLPFATLVLQNLKHPLEDALFAKKFLSVLDPKNIEAVPILAHYPKIVLDFVLENETYNLEVVKNIFNKMGDEDRLTFMQEINQKCAPELIDQKIQQIIGVLAVDQNALLKLDNPQPAFARFILTELKGTAQPHLAVKLLGVLDLEKDVEQFALYPVALLSLAEKKNFSTEAVFKVFSAMEEAQKIAFIQDLNLSASQKELSEEKKELIKKLTQFPVLLENTPTNFARDFACLILREIDNNTVVSHTLAIKLLKDLNIKEDSQLFVPHPKAFAQCVIDLQFDSKLVGQVFFMMPIEAKSQFLEKLGDMYPELNQKISYVESVIGQCLKNHLDVDHFEKNQTFNKQIARWPKQLAECIYTDNIRLQGKYKYIETLWSQFDTAAQKLFVESGAQCLQNYDAKSLIFRWISAYANPNKTQKLPIASRKVYATLPELFFEAFKDLKTDIQKDVARDVINLIPPGKQFEFADKEFVMTELNNINQSPFPSDHVAYHYFAKNPKEFYKNVMDNKKFGKADEDRYAFTLNFLEKLDRGYQGVITNLDNKDFNYLFNRLVDQAEKDNNITTARHILMARFYHAPKRQEAGKEKFVIENRKQKVVGSEHNLAKIAQNYSQYANYSQYN